MNAIMHHSSTIVTYLLPIISNLRRLEFELELDWRLLDSLSLELDATHQLTSLGTP